MADTITTNKVVRGDKQFRGLFSEIWTVKATISDQDAIAIDDTLTLTMDVPGVVLGDVIVAEGLSVDLSDGTDQASTTFAVTAADVVSLYVQADKGELAADALNGGVVRVLVGRPNW